MSPFVPRLKPLLPAALAALGGLLAAVAHPPYGFLPGVFGYALILWALDRAAAGPKPLRGSFLTGWAAGTAYLAVCTVWIVEPFLIDAEQHGWQAPFAVVLCAGGIGLLWGGAGLTYRLLAGRGAPPPAIRVLLFAACFGLWEWVRGHLFTGFPWDLPGETFAAGTALSQGAALIGAYGMSVVVLFVGAAPGVLTRQADPGRRLGQILALGAACGLIGLIGGWGLYYLNRDTPPAGPPVQVRIVQPNLPEPPRWTPEVLERALERYTALTAAPAASGVRPSVVVWPEGAIPETFNALLSPGSASGARIRDSLQDGQMLLSGGLRVTADPSGRDPYGLYYNTLLALRRQGDDLQVLGVYDKHHLVPFGEYLPLARLLGPLGLRKLVSVSADFTPGPSPRPLILPFAVVQPLICYEALFPSLARGDGGARASLLVNVSDDAWFGRHAGPRQHLNIASYRAIEEGLPMLRATPTGVSAVIDGHGRALASLAPDVAGVVDAPLPPALAPTPYFRLREGPFWVLIGLGVAASLMLRRRNIIAF
jgi:apolipoprotein N-acyltransferase